LALSQQQNIPEQAILKKKSNWNFYWKLMAQSPDGTNWIYNSHLNFPYWHDTVK
jgi:hypothetical protein